MGAFWSKKVGSDTYYASYERSFEVLKRDIDKIKVPHRSQYPCLSCCTLMLLLHPAQ